MHNAGGELPRIHLLQRVALILTRTHHACTIGRVDFLAEPSVRIMRYGSSTLKSAVGTSVNKLENGTLWRTCPLTLARRHARDRASEVSKHQRL